jgi:hypothetical protein
LARDLDHDLERDFIDQPACWPRADSEIRSAVAALGAAGALVAEEVDDVGLNAALSEQRVDLGLELGAKADQAGYCLFDATSELTVAETCRAASLPFPAPGGSR